MSFWLIHHTAQTSNRLSDRPNSLYPHSRRSDPFDLTLDDDEDDLYSNGNESIAGARTSGRHTSNRSAHRGRGEDIAIYEDPDDANAYVFPSLRSRLKKTLTSRFS